MEFRKDINGLRAIAVLGVVLYHFRVPGIDGGFAGVDVFFVISGFLMTGIILGKLDGARFSLADFYFSRVKRIVPALLALCAALLVAGWFWLPPGDYTTLGKHATSAVFFVSNFVFEDEDGYFDSPSRDKWLLHTWSLSVEWQFYLLFPLVLMACYRKGRPAFTTLLAVIAGLALVSLLLSVLVTPSKPSATFFLLPARIWEFMAGAFACLVAGRGILRGNRLAEWTGLALIAASFTAFNGNTPWPGSAALLPVIGTTLVIMAARSESIVTGNAVAQRLGAWSYSIYLWHWPVVVALGWLEWVTPAWCAAGIALSLLLGALSYALIETPARRNFLPGPRSRSAVALLVIVVLCGSAGLAGERIGALRELPAAVIAAEQAAANRFALKIRCGYDKKTGVLTRCPIGADGEPAFILWGDSHAPTVATALLEASGKPGLLYSYVCPTMFDVRLKAKAADHPCKEFNDAVLADIATLPPGIPVVIINRLDFYLHGQNEAPGQPYGLRYLAQTPAEESLDDTAMFRKRLVDTLCRVADSRRLFVVMPVPEMGRHVPNLLARRLMTGGNTPVIATTRTEYDLRHRDSVAALQEAHGRCGVTLLDPTPYLCDGETCPGIVAGQPVYFDDDHLNETGSRRLVPMFSRVFTASD